MGRSASARHARRPRPTTAIDRRLTDGGIDSDVDASNGRVDVEVLTDPETDHRVLTHADNGSIDVEYLAVDDR